MSNTLFIGNVYHHFDELPSTNDYARDLAAKSRPSEGTVVVADSQSAGRGQFGSKWESAPQCNLLMSVILYPRFLSPGDQFRLSEAVAIALHECITALVPSLDVKIKWPNDIYLGDRKVAGILIQNALTGEVWQSAIVGIGLNVNQMAFISGAPNPVSLAQASGVIWDINSIRDRLVKCIETRYLQLKNQRDLAELRATYHRHLYRMGQVSRFACPDGTFFSGEIVGVTPDGLLQIYTAGEDRYFTIKEVRFL